MFKMDQLKKIIESAQVEFRQVLLEVMESGGMTLDRYHRFLTMQYHLTKDVQRPFLQIAAHPMFSNKRKLRDFLYNFALEEEPHYQIAEKDLHNLDLKPLEASLDVKLWWAYFNSIIVDRPLVRLGATCILENISVGSADLIKKLLGSASFLNTRNTRFIVIHQHDDLPHGDQIMDIIKSTLNEDVYLRDLEEGAQVGKVLYMRMIEVLK
jgi:hypothetical protein